MFVNQPYGPSTYLRRKFVGCLLRFHDPILSRVWASGKPGVQFLKLLFRPLGFTERCARVARQIGLQKFRGLRKRNIEIVGVHNL
jgi:hypothetical protein